MNFRLLYGLNVQSRAKVSKLRKPTNMQNTRTHLNADKATAIQLRRRHSVSACCRTPRVLSAYVIPPPPPAHTLSNILHKAFSVLDAALSLRPHIFHSLWKMCGLFCSRIEFTRCVLPLPIIVNVPTNLQSRPGRGPRRSAPIARWPMPITPVPEVSMHKKLRYYSRMCLLL